MMGKESATESVISFLRDNSSLLDGYFATIKGSDGCPSYSGLLLETRLVGTTAEKVNFESSLVVRSRVSAFLQEEYISWLGGVIS